jgi:glycosyltransferase involved in cell wall biosynthesis
MRSIRLAFLVHRLITGGAELQMLAVGERLVQQGFRVDFVVRGGVGPHDDRARRAGASVRTIGRLSSSRTPFLTRYRLRAEKHARWIAMARQERYDIVDAWLYPTDVFAALTRPLTRIPVVMSARLDLLPRIRVGPATQLLESAVNRLTNMVVANSIVTADAAINDHGVLPERLRIIRGGVDLPRTFTLDERRAQRAALGASDDHFVIGCVGNFRRMKRQDLLIDAFAKLLPEHRDLRLVLVGDGDLRPQIEEQVGRLGLKGRVVLTGSATDIAPLYDAFDLFVQASNSEALPNVLLEAAASALPIVATAAGGTGELVREGDTGLLVPVDDLGSLTAAVHRAISDANLRRRLGDAARSVVERDYGMDRFAREYADLYREQLTAKGVRV